MCYFNPEDHTLIVLREWKINPRVVFKVELPWLNPGRQQHTNRQLNICMFSFPCHVMLCMILGHCQPITLKVTQAREVLVQHSDPRCLDFQFPKL